MTSKRRSLKGNEKPAVVIRRSLRGFIRLRVLQRKKSQENETDFIIATDVTPPVTPLTGVTGSTGGEALKSADVESGLVTLKALTDVGPVTGRGGLKPTSSEDGQSKKNVPKLRSTLSTSDLLNIPKNTNRQFMAERYRKSSF